MIPTANAYNTATAPDSVAVKMPVRTPPTMITGITSASSVFTKAAQNLEIVVRSLTG